MNIKTKENLKNILNNQLKLLNKQQDNIKNRNKQFIFNWTS